MTLHFDCGGWLRSGPLLQGPNSANFAEFDEAAALPGADLGEAVDGSDSASARVDGDGNIVVTVGWEEEFESRSEERIYGSISAWLQASGTTPSR